jgi:hypothetical protein
MKRLILLCIATFITTTLGAQSLAEVAEKEKQRRKQLDGSGTRTVTDVELRRVGGPLTSVTSSSTSADPDNADEVGEAELESDEEEPVDERRDEAYWRGRLEPIDTRIETMESRLAGPEFTSNPVGASDRERLEQQLARARAERQAVLDEARRKGVPPGWLR